MKRMDEAQLANVLATLALHIVERMTKSIEEVAQHGAAAPAAIIIIWQHPGETIDRVGKLLGLSHSGTVRLVERLMADNLVMKEPAADARAVALTCTKLGAHKARGIIKARQDVVDPIVNALSPNERRQLETILRKIPWRGVNSQERAIHACRLCNYEICDSRGNCPVTIARSKPVAEGCN